MCQPPLFSTKQAKNLQDGSEAPWQQNAELIVAASWSLPSMVSPLPTTSPEVVHHSLRTIFYCANCSHLTTIEQKVRSNGCFNPMKLSFLDLKILQAPSCFLSTEQTPVLACMHTDHLSRYRGNTHLQMQQDWITGWVEYPKSWIRNCSSFDAFDLLPIFGNGSSTDPYRSYSSPGLGCSSSRTGVFRSLWLIMVELIVTYPCLIGGRFCFLFGGFAPTCQRSRSDLGPTTWWWPFA